MKAAMAGAGESGPTAEAGPFAKIVQESADVDEFLLLEDCSFNAMKEAYEQEHPTGDDQAYIYTINGERVDPTAVDCDDLLSKLGHEAGAEIQVKIKNERKALSPAEQFLAKIPYVGEPNCRR